MQLEWSLAAQKNRDQARTQQQAKTVGKRLDHRIHVRSAVQRCGYVGQDFGAPVFFARDFDQPRRFEQAAQLSRDDCGFGCQVFVKELILRIM